ncbi:MAG TPA: hypothetical protein VGC84_07505 [Ilumatobacteraceae bacterium]|jgi:hypothetical protein
MHRAAFIRLASFVLVIAGTFGTAYGVGRKLPGNPESKPHTHGPVKPSLVPPGFTSGGYVLINESTSTKASVGLHIDGPDGARVTQFVDANGSQLHVVLIRFDDSGFEHLRPAMAANGSFSVAIDHRGKWHIIVESQPVGAPAPVVLTTNVDDEVPIDQVSLPAPHDTVKTDGLVVTRSGLTFTVTSKDGAAAEGLEPYLGQPAHLIAIRRGDLAYSHLHPIDATAGATFAFEGSLSPGTYRLFLEFGHDGKVDTAAFTVVQP